MKSKHQPHAKQMTGRPSLSQASEGQGSVRSLPRQTFLMQRQNSVKPSEGFKTCAPSGSRRVLPLPKAHASISLEVPFYYCCIVY